MCNFLCIHPLFLQFANGSIRFTQFYVLDTGDFGWHIAINYGDGGDLVKQGNPGFRVSTVTSLSIHTSDISGLISHDETQFMAGQLAR
ncbi:hypothetical protein B0H10DRAFT_465167 [Mycena sp. CBHHK59/15]|nr:hypothetical protein B0H10DRAFT_465167 [Mycena sp. CBHHK59/15]